MKSTDTSYSEPQANPRVVGKYLVYGDSKPDAGGGYQAWFWIDIPNPAGQAERVRGPERFGVETQATPGLAAIHGISWGMEVAKTLPGGT